MARSEEERLKLLDELAEPLHTGVELSTFYGFGLGLFGALRDRAIAPQYVLGVWFKALHIIPIWPVSAYLVGPRRNLLEAHPVYARLKLGDVVRIWGVGRLIWLLISGFVTLAIWAALIIGVGAFLIMLDERVR